MSGTIVSQITFDLEKPKGTIIKNGLLACTRVKSMGCQGTAVYSMHASGISEDEDVFHALILSLGLSYGVPNNVLLNSSGLYNTKRPSTNQWALRAMAGHPDTELVEWPKEYQLGNDGAGWDRKDMRTIKGASHTLNPDHDNRSTIAMWLPLKTIGLRGHNRIPIINASPSDMNIYERERLNKVPAITLKSKAGEFKFHLKTVQGTNCSSQYDSRHLNYNWTNKE